MKRLLTVLTLLLCVGARAAIYQNSFTTNSNGKTPNVLATSTNVLYPLMVLNPDGSGTDRAILFSQFLTLTSTNTTLGGNLSLNGRTNRLSILNDVLLLDGVPVTSTINAPVTNFYSVSNFFNVAKGGHLTISNSLTLQPVKTNILATDATGLVTNAIIGSGLSYDATTRTLTATASSGGVNTHVTTLTWSGTNITGFDCATNAESFYLLATNNAHFGSSTFSNLPAKTAYQTYTLCVQMDSTGGRIITFTNTVVGWALAQPVFIETNANAVSYVYLHTDLTTNSTLVGTANVDVRR